MIWRWICFVYLRVCMMELLLADFFLTQLLLMDLLSLTPALHLPLVSHGRCHWAANPRTLLPRTLLTTPLCTTTFRLVSLLSFFKYLTLTLGRLLSFLHLS